MSEQRHVIKRQVIELTIQGRTPARPMQELVSRVYRQRIMPLIERRCSELSGPDEVYRIDQLELDLGEIEASNLEAELVARVDAALRRELARQIPEPGGAARKVQSQLELLAFFARSGSLPWWADAAQPALLAQTLERLLADSPAALAALLQELARESGPLRRLVRHWNDDELAALCALLSPAAQALRQDFPELLAGLQRARPAIPAERLRQTAWEALLSLAAAGEQQPAGRADYYTAALRRTGLALDSPALLADFRQELARRGAAGLPGSLPAGMLLADSPAAHLQGELARRLAELLGRLDGTSAPPSEAAVGQKKPALPLPALPSGLTAQLAALPAEEQAALLAILEAERGGAGLQLSAQRLLVRLSRLLPAEPGPEFSALLQRLRTAAGESATKRQPRGLPAGRKSPDLRFSQAEETPVANAGLVILWPFLGSFFTRLGLLDEQRRFRGEPARQRAVGLLQVVASQETAPPEYLLPLNKLLCGMEAGEVFDFGPPLLESEAQECENLLDAVIAQAAILKEMSHAGLRGSFLLRAGILGARDGMGLLRVERQSYDIVLERFPWGWEWVRLPWMETPLRVEW